MLMRVCHRLMGVFVFVVWHLSCSLSLTFVLKLIPARCRIYSTINTFVSRLTNPKNYFQVHRAIVYYLNVLVTRPTLCARSYTDNSIRKAFRARCSLDITVPRGTPNVAAISL